MQYCPKCKVSITGNKRCCPLCQHSLQGEGDPLAEIFPDAPAPMRQNRLMIKIATLAALGVTVITLMLNIIIPSPVAWWGFAAAGAGCAWLTFIVGLLKKHNIFKNISWQLFFLTILLLLWDHFTGRYGWSVDFALPCLYCTAILFMMIWGLIKKKPAAEYLIYMLLDCLYCILPVIFLSINHVRIVIPSVICAGLGFLAISGILVFKGKFIVDELYRKMHL